MLFIYKLLIILYYIIVLKILIKDSLDKKTETTIKFKLTDNKMRL